MYKIIVGDSREVIKTLAEKSVNCVVTSPPYFGLRNYGNDAQIGLEDSPEKYIEEMVKVFREVKRVLRDDGTVWLNIGDSYASFRDSKVNPQTVSGKPRGEPTGGDATNRNPKILKAAGLKHKDLIGIPWMLAFALRADGWYLRQDIIWHKPNPMPESVKDRCTKSHEYIFLLSKSERYYYDNTAILEDAKWDRWGDQTVVKEQQGTAKWIGNKPKSDLQAIGKKNKRSVWSIPTKPFRGAHFATFPPALVEPCILAGCPKGGVVLDPFGGAGTTALVAEKLERDSILIELNPKYASMAQERIDATVKPTLMKLFDSSMENNNE